MNRVFSYLLFIVTCLFTFTGCNHREFCDFAMYEERAKIVYIWDVPEGFPKSETLNLEVTNTNYMTSKNMYITPNETYLLDDTPMGQYNAFVYNDAENVIVTGRIFTAATNPDGSLKKVGSLFSAENDFEIRDPEIIEEEYDRNNNHHWDEGPYHVGTKYLYKNVILEMAAQSREIKIILKLPPDAEEYVKNISGVLSGICKSKESNGSVVSSGNINLKFEIVNNTIVASYTVLGTAPFEHQMLTLDVEYKDGSHSSPDPLDITEALDGFNQKLGNEPAVVQLEFDIKKEGTYFTATIIDWEIVEYDDYKDLEI